MVLRWHATHAGSTNKHKSLIYRLSVSQRKATDALCQKQRIKSTEYSYQALKYFTIILLGLAGYEMIYNQLGTMNVGYISFHIRQVGVE